MKNCPKCNSTRWDGRFCKRCKFINDPRHLTKKFSEQLKGGKKDGDNKDR
jgi:ssDNA-binding Zn-finger/Zn-ribbon topoisomerase 1